MAYRPDVDALEGRELLTSYKFATLASFTSAESPTGGLVMDARGDLFGTTFSGGAAGGGTLFELPRGGHRVITRASFTSATGEVPVGSLAIDSRGDVFGTTQDGGANNRGTIFELARGSRRVAVLASFGFAQAGQARVTPTGLVRDSHGNLYGTATGGLGSSSFIYELPAGSHTISTLQSFPSNDFGGVFPSTSLAVDAHGDLFGSVGGFAQAPGFLFELPTGTDTLTNLAIGGADLIVLGKNGTLYGVAGDSVLSYQTGSGASTLTTIASFQGSDGLDPNSSAVVNVDGDVFGTTMFGGPGFVGVGPSQAEGSGTVYEIAAGSGTVSSLVAFTGSNGLNPDGLVEDSRGDLFGVTTTGGPTGNGTVFELAVVPTPRGRR